MEVLAVIGAYTERVVGQLIMFFATGILFEFVLEWLKAGIRNKTGKAVPKWIGIVLGLGASAVYIASAYWASVTATTLGWEIPGSPVFLYVWFWIFFFWQYGCVHIAKPIFKKLLPYVYYENYEKPEKTEKKDQLSILQQEFEELKKNLTSKEETN